LVNCTNTPPGCPLGTITQIIHFIACCPDIWHTSAERSLIVQQMHLERQRADKQASAVRQP
jgi:hypothetical protein